jgi:hypothetical protein
MSRRKRSASGWSPKGWLPIDIRKDRGYLPGQDGNIVKVICMWSTVKRYLVNMKENVTMLALFDLTDVSLMVTAVCIMMIQ